MEETGGEAAPSGMIKFERNVRGGPTLAATCSTLQVFLILSGKFLDFYSPEQLVAEMLENVADSEAHLGCSGFAHAGRPFLVLTRQPSCAPTEA